MEILARPATSSPRTAPRCSSAHPEAVPEPLLDAARRQIAIGHERDIDADPSFGIRQLVDIALRAISPGINDPTTAVTCIHYLQNIFECLSERSLPEHVSFDGEPIGVRAHQRTFIEYVEPLSEIARYATADVRVASALFDAITACANVAGDVDAHERRHELTRLAADLARPAAVDARTTHDRELLAAALPTEAENPSRSPRDPTHRTVL